MEIGGSKIKFVKFVTKSYQISCNVQQWGARSANSKLVPRKYCRQTGQGLTKETHRLSTRATSGCSANAHRPFKPLICNYNQHENKY